ncbi:MAG: hypothetical protein ACFHXK_12315 [bacterium]
MSTEAEKKTEVEAELIGMGEKLSSIVLKYAYASMEPDRAKFIAESLVEGSAAVFLMVAPMLPIEVRMVYVSDQGGQEIIAQIGGEHARH